MSDRGYHCIRELIGAEQGKTALVVCGGMSGKDWQQYPADFIIAVNGAVTQIPDCRYFMCTECDVVGDYIHTETPAHRILNPRWAKRMARKDNVYAAHKSDEETDIRNVSAGIWRGPNCSAGGVGTSALGALHFAGILGCTRVHSVGIDLCFKSDDAHHWYDERRYFSDLLAGCNQSLVECRGLRTMPFWVESAKYLLWWRDAYATPGRLDWQDHSSGLLQALDGA